MTWLLSLALAAPVAHPTRDALAAWLREHHDAAHTAAVWRSPTTPERRALMAGAATLARAVDTCPDHAVARATAELARAGLDLAVHTVGDATFLVLTDATDRGAGWSVWRCGPSSELIVQAPHAFHDLQTAPLALAAFLGTGARGAMFNSVHRYRAEPDERPEDEVHPADVTRQPASDFHTLTLTWTAVRPESRVVQLHGFGDDLTDADVVLSTTAADTGADGAAAALTAALPDHRVATWGVDVHVLGGTTNALAPSLGRAGRLLHVELSRELRRTLARDPGTAARALASLEGPWSR